MLFKIFEKLSQVFKYFKKGYEQKIVLGFSRFCKYDFFKYLKKGISKKIVLGFLRFCNTMAPSYHGKVSSTQNKGVPFFSCLGHRV